MPNMIDLLRGAMSAAKAPASAGNDGSDRARVEAEHTAALANYQNVMKSTNDQKQQADAHKRLLDATAALGQQK